MLSFVLCLPIKVPVMWLVSSLFSEQKQHLKTWHKCLMFEKTQMAEQVWAEFCYFSSSIAWNKCHPILMLFLSWSVSQQYVPPAVCGDLHTYRTYGQGISKYCRCQFSFWLKRINLVNTSCVLLAGKGSVGTKLACELLCKRGCSDSISE